MNVSKFDMENNEEEGKDTKKSVNYLINDKEINAYCYHLEQNFWKPGFRECTAFVIDKGKGYLFGGIG